MVSECVEDKDKLDTSIEYLNMSEFSNDDDRQMMIDFIHLRPVHGAVAGTFVSRDAN